MSMKTMNALADAECAQIEEARVAAEAAGHEPSPDPAVRSFSPVPDDCRTPTPDVHEKNGKQPDELDPVEFTDKAPTNGKIETCKIAKEVNGCADKAKHDANSKEVKEEAKVEADSPILERKPEEGERIEDAIAAAIADQANGAVENKVENVADNHEQTKKPEENSSHESSLEKVDGERAHEKNGKSTPGCENEPERSENHEKCEAKEKQNGKSAEPAGEDSREKCEAKEGENGKSGEETNHESDNACGLRSLLIAGNGKAASCDDSGVAIDDMEKDVKVKGTEPNSDEAEVKPVAAELDPKPETAEVGSKPEVTESESKPEVAEAELKSDEAESKPKPEDTKLEAAETEVKAEVNEAEVKPEVANSGSKPEVGDVQLNSDCAKEESNPESTA